MDRNTGGALNLISGKALEKELKLETQKVIKEFGSEILKLIEEKISREHQARDSQYALDKIYQILLKFDSKKLLDLSNKILNIFKNYIHSEYYQTLWTGMDGQLPEIEAKAQIKRGSELILSNGTKTTVVSMMHESCQDFELFQNFATPIRAQWYATIAQLIYCKSENNQFFVPDKVPYGVPPLIVKRDKNGYLYALEKRLPIADLNQLAEKTDLIKSIEKFHIAESKKKQRKWGMHKDVMHCMDWSNPGTFFMLYAYTYTPVEDNQNIVTDLVTDYQMEAFLADKGNCAMTTSELYKKIEEKNLWQKLEKEFDYEKNSKSSSSKSTSLRRKKPEDIKEQDTTLTKEIIQLDSDRISGIKLFINLIIELETTLKDINSQVIVRSESKDDILAASRLIEKIMLPKYFDIKISGNIFENHNN